jgi:hypothetical protein
MRSLDLGKRAPTDTDVLAESYKRQKEDGAAPGVELKPLTPRVVTLRLKVRNPETGLPQVCAVESTAPNADMRRRMGIEAAKLAGGVQWGQLPFGDAAYIGALARIAVQCAEIPAELRWVLNDAGYALALQEALVDHDQRYFRGDDGPSDSSPVFPWVERPWAESRPEPGEGTSPG